MSVCVRIRTESKPTPEAVFKALSQAGEQLAITSPDYPSAKAGTISKALRGIELNDEDNGIEVRICSFGSQDDYRLFAKTVNAVMELSGGKAYYEDDDDEPIIDPLRCFDEEWAKSERESGFDILKSFSCQYGETIVLTGLFANICVGPHLFKGFGIDNHSKQTGEVIDQLQDYLVSVQWHLAGKKDTSTLMAMPDPNNPDERMRTISMIRISDGKVIDFDYISYADFFGIIDLDHEEIHPVLIPFDKLYKIIPDEGFRIIDENQFERTEEITPDTVRTMMEVARYFQPNDLMHRPLSPGEGFDETQNTVILMWNPAISSVKMEDHNATIPDIFTKHFNWSVCEYEEAKCGDRFFLIRCGEGNTGIVMSGIFDSHPYEAGDWSGKGQRTFYMEMEPNVILNPDEAPMVTTEELEKAIPDFQWSCGHSGRILPPNDARKLEKLWHNYLKKNHDAIDGKTMNASRQYEEME